MLSLLQPSWIAPIAAIALGAFMLVASCSASAAGTGDELQRVQDDFQERAARAHKEYRKSLVKYAHVAVGKYEKLAVESVRSGDLALATSAMRAILKLDRDHKKAVAHFKAIGRLDEVLKELAEEPSIDFSEAGGGGGTGSSKLARRLAGTTWTWAKNKIVFSANGAATVSGDKQPNTRHWYVDGAGNIHVASTLPASFYAIIQFDSQFSVYKGKGFHLSSPEAHSGKRIR